MSAITILVDNMAAEFNRMKGHLMTLLARKVESADLADNTLRLGEYTATSLGNEAKADANLHINNKENPHGTTAVQLLGTIKPTVDNSIAGRIPEGILPISRYGELSGSAIPVTSAALTVMFTGEVSAMMNGYARKVPAGTFDLAPNTTYYVYLRWNGSEISYYFTTQDLAETATRMYIGRVVTGATTVTTLSLVRITRIDTYRLSTSPIGSAIPVASGNASDPSNLAAGWFN
jgi:hypothetical protein